MWKKLLVVAVLLGFAWSFPPTRRRMMDALAPALVKLGPVGERIVEPTRRYDARNEVDFIVDMIELNRTEGRPIPTPRTFEKWVRDRVTTRRNGIDPWGKAYYMLRLGKKTTVGSEGPDGQRGTADDIQAVLLY